MTTHSSAGEGLGLCAVCPVRLTCPAAAHGRTTCPVTGSLPPPAPPDHAPADGGPTVESTPEDGSGFADAASRGLEKAISAVLGLGWTDLLAVLIERTNGRDADGNAIDWSRLQLSRNLLSIGIAALVPLGGTPAASWVARWLETSFTTHGINGLFAPAGAALMAAGVLLLGRFLPGLVGDLCGAGWGVATTAVRATRWVLRSRLGWLLSRPAIWAAIAGVLIVSWRGLVYVLTGAS
jgi:hypothetical protein